MIAQEKHELKNNFFFIFFCSISSCLLLNIILFSFINPFLPISFALDWQIFTTPHFNLYYQEKDRLLASYIIERAEKDYKRIVLDIGIDPGISAKVYLAPNQKIFKSLQPQGSKTQEWSVGVFYPGLNLILLLSSKAYKQGRLDLQKIMAHEITHFIIYNVTTDKGNNLPKWLHEGLAMYEAREWNWHHSLVMAQISISRSFLPLSSLEKGFPGENKSAERAYAQSMSLISYIINKHGSKSLYMIIKNLIGGMQTEEAFEDALGISLKNFEIQWHKYLRRHYTWISVLSSSFSIWFFITILAIVIYTHKRREAKEKIASWEIEDQLDIF